MKRRIFRVARLFLFAAFLGIGYLVFWKLTGLGFFCPIKRFLGWDCPGCGITRAAWALLRLDFPAMLEANLLSPLMVLYCLYAALYAAIGYVTTGKYEMTPRPLWLSVILLALFLIWGVVRNLSGFQALL